MRSVCLLAIGLTVNLGFGQAPTFQYPPTLDRRTLVVATLRNGISDVKVQGYFEDYIAEGAYWYHHGDRAILRPLLEAHTDGAASEMLGGFLGNELMRNPSRFLKDLSKLPQDLQIRAASYGVAADGSGWTPEENNKIHKILKARLRDSDPRVRAAARVWQMELQRFISSPDQ